MSTFSVQPSLVESNETHVRQKKKTDGWHAHGYAFTSGLRYSQGDARYTLSLSLLPSTVGYSQTRGEKERAAMCAHCERTKSACLSEEEVGRTDLGRAAQMCASTPE
mmetsp:Transcript_47550/g.93832  ORF Transcript_47550/g.93832 Transcript_47550/m.93832 type:complete len:107 (-) Transcript_47550:1863-2183(-)